jgi:hypothetical protein
MATNQQIADAYIEFLAKEGYRPEKDKDGDIMFKREGGTYYFIIDEADELYFYMLYPNFCPYEGDERRKKILEACNYANTKSKAVKIRAYATDVVASIEMFMADKDAYKPVFERAVRAIQNGVGNFIEKLKELDAPPKAAP